MFGSSQLSYLLNKAYDRVSEALSILEDEGAVPEAKAELEEAIQNLDLALALEDQIENTYELEDAEEGDE